MTQNNLAQDLEWEGFSTPAALQENCHPSVSDRRATTTVVIERDSQLDLRLTIESLSSPRDDDEAVDPGDEPVAGIWQRLKVVELESYGALYQCTQLPDATTLTDHYSGATGLRRVTEVFELQRVERSWPNGKLVSRGGRLPSSRPPAPPSWTSDWYVNGPGRKALFPRSSARTTKRVFTRRRPGKSVTFREGAIAPSGSSCDHLRITVPGGHLVISKVPDEYGPAWAGPIGLEFHGDCQNDRYLRDGIAEILSFLLGRPLIRVGSTSYDREGFSLTESAQSPGVIGLRERCQLASKPPVALGWAHVELESLLKKAIPRYMKCRTIYKLSDALRLYWIACESPLESSLPIYSAALETIEKAWSRQHPSKRQTKFISTKVFRKFFGAALKNARRAAENEDNLRRVVDAMYEANNPSTMRARMDIFYQGLGLQIGKVERGAITARGSRAHGDIGTMSGEEPTHLNELMHPIAYRGLLNRIVLAVLGLDCEYVDYTVAGQPTREINDAAGGLEYSCDG